MIVAVRTVTGGVQRCKVYDSQDITSFAALVCGRRCRCGTGHNGDTPGHGHSGFNGPERQRNPWISDVFRTLLRLRMEVSAAPPPPDITYLDP